MGLILGILGSLLSGMESPLCTLLSLLRGLWYPVFLSGEMGYLWGLVFLYQGILLLLGQLGWPLLQKGPVLSTPLLNSKFPPGCQSVILPLVIWSLVGFLIEGIRNLLGSFGSLLKIMSLKMGTSGLLLKGSILCRRWYGGGYLSSPMMQLLRRPGLLSWDKGSALRTLVSYVRVPVSLSSGIKLSL